MQTFSVFRLIALAMLLGGCTEQSVPETSGPVVNGIAAGENSLGPRLARGADDVTILSWMERDEKGATLKFSTLEDGKWQAPVAVISDPEMFVNWADLPAVTPIRDDLWVAHWLSYSADGVYSYDVLTAQSNDQGQSWSNAVRPHADGTPTEHGFVSVYPEVDGTGLLWLDGRKMINETAADPTANGMTLRSTILTPDGSLQGKSVVDELICDCCQTDVAIAADGPVAVYRDRTIDEIRDIFVTRFVDGAWQPGVALAHDNWHIAGCPVNGPAIDADGQLVVAAWFTAAGGKPLVQVAVSDNSGRTFSSAMEIPAQQAIGRVGVAIIDQTSFAVSWLDTDKNGSYSINVRNMTVDGQAGPTRVVARTGLMRIVPQMVRVADKLVLAWTDKIGDSSGILSVEIPILSLDDS
ncbi:MAG: hypothetical protein IIB74_12800 [Proteobacteria bacterium]|nr:hypothetical protein [Pseudomonadota bacterium]